MSAPETTSVSTKDRLIVSAVELIVEQGSIDLVSMRAIAKRAGVSPTAVYRHYADFDELISATVAWSWDRFDEAVNEQVGHIDDPYARLQASGEAYVHFALGQPGLYRVLFSIGGRAAVLRKEVGLPVFGKLVDNVAAVLDASGDDRSSLEVAGSVFTWIHGAADLRLAAIELPASEVEQQVASIMRDLRLAAI